jgi:hypothetical protein
VRYVHLTKGQAYPQETNPGSRQRGCCIRTITARVLLENISGRCLEGLDAKPQTASRKVTLTLTVTVTVRILTSSLSLFSAEGYSRFACGVAGSLTKPVLRRTRPT